MRKRNDHCSGWLFSVLMFCVFLCAAPSFAADWPMWRYDAGRTAATPAELPSELALQWVVKYSPRKTVWDDPLNQDLMPYDRVLEPVVVGKTLLLGFNDADKLVALDTGSGKERWRMYTDGPVRLPPAAADGKVYFVSDDGYLYCVRVLDGSLLWKFRGGPSDRKIIGNRRLISSWPARGAPVVRDGTVYFAASIWPLMGTFIYALDAGTGAVQWVNDRTGPQYLDQPHNYPAFAGVAPQGPLVATQDKLLIPGGRSIPACLDRHTGRFLYFHLAKYGKFGGSSVFATDEAFFGHERAGVFGRYQLETGDVQDGVRGRQPVLGNGAIYYSGESVEKRLAGQPEEMVWTIAVDATGDLIGAGNRLYAAGKGSITAIQLPTEDGTPEVAWRMELDGEVERLLAADDKLFAVTLDGRLLAYGAQEPQGEPARLDHKPIAGAADPDADRQAKSILERTGVKEGYALFYGVGNGALLEALARNSELKIAAIDPDTVKIERLRRRYDAAGLYGRRIALCPGDLHSFQSPPYMASLTVVGDAAAAGFRGDAASLERIFHSLRPYGGVAWLPHAAEGDRRLAQALQSADLLKAKLVAHNGFSLLSRQGTLPGAGVWTHQYGNIANTVKSDDSLVRLPLGILWFGGSSNMDVLPRHGHGPPEQVIGGRLFIQGMDCLSARDVYTGRVLWKVQLDELNTFGIYYDQTYKNLPLTLEYNQVHIPGANARGTNFVATLDRVYILQSTGCRVLDSATGKTLGTISLPGSEDGRHASAWGYIGVHENYLIGGAGYSEFSQRLGVPHDRSDTRRSRWRFTDYDKSASEGLVVMDRTNGKEIWRMRARHGFIHNAITAAGGTLFCLDKLPPNLEARLARRGAEPPGSYRLVAVDIHTGRIQWENNENVFGTWLSYSSELDILLQSTRPSGDTVRGEEGKRMIAYSAATGELLWDKNIRYSTPPILHGKSVITGGKKYSLRTGEVEFRTDPLTGARSEWSYVSTKGCNYPVASENLLTFRSSAAAFYDLLADGGTGHFGGFKSGCTSNLIVADGVLNAPDYTRTCRCSFQNQTSLALVHMPELEIWTHNDFDYDGKLVRQVGINFGAPGDRRAENRTLWLDFPSVGGPSPNIDVRVDGSLRYFRHHSSRVSGQDPSWVGASGVQGADTIRIRLEPEPDEDAEVRVSIAAEYDDAEEDASGNVDLTSSDLELTVDDSRQTVGVRFKVVPIPPGSKIQSATIQFQVDESSSSPALLRIYGQAADSAPGFTESQRDISSRKKTTAMVHWKPKAWTEVGLAGPEQRTPNLAAIVQEIVDRPGWKHGGAVAFLITGVGKHAATSFDGIPTGAPKLVLALDDAAKPKISRKSNRIVRTTPYTVRLYFAEPDDSLDQGDRVFSVALQGKTVLNDLDIMREALGPHCCLVKEFRGIPLGDELRVKLTPVRGRPAVLCGIELIAERL